MTKKEISVINSAYKKWEGTNSLWLDLNQQLWDTGIAYLKELLSKLPGHEIEINEDCPVSVPYDGGRHPEYDSNCFSNVERVYLDEDGDLYLAIEETDEYDIDDIEASDLADVIDAVKETIDKDYDLTPED